MLRELRDFGLDRRIVMEAARLAAAAAAGALLTFWLVGHGDTVARTPARAAVVPQSAGMPGTVGAINPLGDHSGAPMPELLAPDDADERLAQPAERLPQRDAHSDGGGH
jgi:hypothetical protein